MSEVSEIKIVPKQGAQSLTNSEYEAYLEDLLDLNALQKLNVKSKPEPFIDSITPVDSPLQGIYKQSSAYYSLNERMPSILNKVIDYLTRESSNISASYDASEGEISIAIKYMIKLRKEIEVNEKFTLLKEKTIEAEKWNEYIRNIKPLTYFTCIWVFSECYVYRRLHEPFALSRTLQNFDPFGHQKEKAFKDNMEQMCLVANRLSQMVKETDCKEKRRQNLILLLKLCLWGNKQDLSLSMGSDINNLAMDPIQLIDELNTQILADESGKAVDAICAGIDKIIPNEKNDNADEVVSNGVIFDIVCDNAGYELFTDLCLAHYLLDVNIVDRVRFHVKQIPWFVSDTTPKDVQYVVNGCVTTSFTKEPNPLSSKEMENGEVELKLAQHALTSSQLNAFGRKCEKYIKDGSILIQSDDYWTSPCVYKDMKTIDPQLYKKLQRPVAILFKGDLNYRKLMGDQNWNPTTEFETGLEGFHPAPLIAARTVKCKLICGLTPTTLEKVNRLDYDWMETGDFGLKDIDLKVLHSGPVLVGGCYRLLTPMWIHRPGPTALRALLNLP